MPTWALVPLKNLAQAKSRLAPAVDASTRRAMVLAMAEDVLAVLNQAECVERVLLVSNEPEAGSLLGQRRLDVFYSSDGEGLNRELEQAAAYAAAQGADRVLILHADLPWLDRESLESLISKCPETSVCVAQDKLGTGTNAILAPLPLPVPLVFGVNSLAAFRAGASEQGRELRIVDEPRLAQDIDGPEDFQRLVDECAAGLAPGPATFDLLKRLGHGRAERIG